MTGCPLMILIGAVHNISAGMSNQVKSLHFPVLKTVQNAKQTGES